MIYIKKGQEPKSLTEYKKKIGASYAGLETECKDDIRKSLLHEQGNLCAYCMQRISENAMKIEHWIPEEKLTDYERLNYNNMLGCCYGHEKDTKSSELTCDSNRKSEKLTIDPRDATLISLIKYNTLTGEIYSDNEEINKDLNKTLNLNSKTYFLKENRKAVYDEFIRIMSKRKKSGTWSNGDLRKIYQHYLSRDEKDNLKEYSGIVLWYLENRLK